VASGGSDLKNFPENQLAKFTQCIFTARCYAEGGIVTASCLVRSSALVTLTYRDHIGLGWKSSKIISRLVSLECSLSAGPQSRFYSTPKKTKHPKILSLSNPPSVDLSVADI